RALSTLSGMQSPFKLI
ncbi:unnamed protein product, partial [Oikopleura dioica]